MSKVLYSSMMLLSRKLLFLIRGRNKWRYIILICGLVFILSSMLYSAVYNLPHNIEHNMSNNQCNKSTEKSLKATLVIIIISGPDNFNERETIRETWLKNVDRTNVIAKFVIGIASLDRELKQKIKKEESVHGDLIILDSMIDSYQGLTNKVLQAFLWLNENVQFEYMLKVDDDSYVRVAELMVEMQKKPKEKLYWGFFDGRANVKVSGKWKESDWNLCDKYLPYARGGGYVLSSDLVCFIATNHLLFQHYLSEDVSVGTWLAPLKINRHHDQNFDTEYVSRGCLNSYLITHKQSASAMRELHDNLMTLGKLCKAEHVTRGSYEYNWSYPPSKCCIRENKPEHEKEAL